jgi:hypothetical protein
MSSKWDQYVVDEPTSGQSKWDQYVVQDETPEQHMEQTIGHVPSLKEAFFGRQEDTPAMSLIKKRPSELIRRPVKGLLDLLQSISPSLINPMNTMKGVPTPGEFVKGDASQLSPEEEQAGQTLEFLTQLGVPLMPKGTGALAKTEAPIAKGAEDIAKLKVPRIAEEGRKVSKLLKPRVLPQTLKKEEIKLLKQGEQILSDVKKSKFPLVRQIEAGKPVENITNKQFGKIARDAEKITGKVKVDNIKNSIQKNIDKYSKARTPAATEKTAIKTGKGLIKDLEKGDMSMKELVGQYRANNKASKSLIEKTLTEGTQSESLEMYQAANDAIAKEISKHPNASNIFKTLFKQSNANYAQLKKIDQYESIMKSVINDKGMFEPKKLSRALQDSKKIRQLSKIVGTDTVNGLRKMSTQLTQAQEALAKVDPLQWKDLSVSAPMLMKYIGIPGGKLIGAPIMAKKGADIAYGYYLMRPESRKVMSGLVRAIKAKNYDKAKQIGLKLEVGFKKAKKDDEKAK